MLRDELQQIGDPALRQVLDHPFWAGLRDGSLPAEALLHFVFQDTDYLLPAFSRALARCAATAVDDKHALLLMHGAYATLEASDRLNEAFIELAEKMNVQVPDQRPAIAPTTNSYCSLFAAASARSLASGIGISLPIVWFQLDLSDDLIARMVAESRYAPWIKSYHPGDAYRPVVQEFLAMADEIGERCSAEQRQELIAGFGLAVHYEWRFAEAAFRREQG